MTTKEECRDVLVKAGDREPTEWQIRVIHDFARWVEDRAVAKGKSEEFPTVHQFVEVHALWMLMEEREDEVSSLLEKMTATELYEFERQIHGLRALVNSAFWRKKSAAGKDDEPTR